MVRKRKIAKQSSGRRNEIRDSFICLCVADIYRRATHKHTHATHLLFKNRIDRQVGSRSDRLVVSQRVSTRIDRIISLCLRVKRGSPPDNVRLNPRVSTDDLCWQLAEPNERTNDRGRHDSSRPGLFGGHF